MPFCPKCGYDYREGATRCSTCGGPLIAEAPREERRVGFAPLDRVLDWFARGAFWRAWIEIARADLLSFPRLFTRGTATVFRNPVLYLLPLVLLFGNQWLMHRNLAAMQRQEQSRPFAREEGPPDIRAAVVKRVVGLPAAFAHALSSGQAGYWLRDALPAVPLPAPGLLRQLNPAAPRWLDSRAADAAWFVIIALAVALFYAGMFARLKSLTAGETPEAFLYGLDRFFTRMAGLTLVTSALLFGWISLWRQSTWMPSAAAVARSYLMLVLFVMAPCAVVVEGVHIHRAIATSVKFVLRHLPAFVVLLVAATFVWSLILAIAASPVSFDPSYALRDAPAALLLMLFGLCVWGMMMQWYVEAARRQSPLAAKLAQGA